MQIIQSLECVELKLSANSRSVDFPRNFLNSKNVSSFYIFSNTQDNNLYSPYSKELILQYDEMDDLALYVNLISKSGKPICKNLCADLINIKAEPFNDFIQLRFNNSIDWIQSEIIIAGTQLGPKLLLYAVYNDYKIEEFSPVINGLVRVSVPLKDSIFDYYDIRLSDFVDKELYGKKIKKILVSIKINGYLDLVTNKGLIKNIPTPFLHISQSQSKKDFYFDNVIIDYEKSFLRIRKEFLPGNENYLTFIY